MWCLGSPSSPLPVWVSVNHCLWYNRSRFFRNLVAYFPASACAAKSLQLCLTLCDPIDGSPHQAPQSLGFPRQEYWSGLPFPSPMHACMLSHFSCVQLCATLWTAAHQASLSTGFSRQEYWSGLPFPSPIHACMLSCFSRVQLCATLWTAALQTPLSTGFSRQEYWSGLPVPSPKHFFSCIQWSFEVVF